MFVIEWILTAWIVQTGLKERNGGRLHRKESSYGTLGKSMIHSLAATEFDDDADFHNKDDDMPPNFTVIDDDDDELLSSLSANTLNGKIAEGRSASPTAQRTTGISRKDGTFQNPESASSDSSSATRWPKPPQRPNRPRAVPGPKLDEDSSWMDRNTQYSSSGTGKSFREDFRGTRVFVQGIPEGVSWQTLKDHFRKAGAVVFASVSYNGDTGIVQYETTDQAANAIQIMRDYPLDGANLYVRADLQENKSEKQLVKKKRNNNESSSVFWQCASPDYVTVMDSEKIQAIESILMSRDQARRRRNFAAADSMREQLRFDFGVQLDDRSHLWWISTDDEGQRSTGQSQWEQIETDHDDVVDSSYVFSLLKQRDVSLHSLQVSFSLTGQNQAARRQKDFTTADALLEKACTAPKGEGVSLRIHDESRTWRVWLDRPQSFTGSKSNLRRDQAPPPESSRDETDEEASYRAKCLALMEQHDPDRVPEVIKLLDNFPASSVWPRLSQRYL